MPFQRTPLPFPAARRSLRQNLWRALLLCSLTLGAQAAEVPALDTQAIDALVQREMSERQVPGIALAIVHRGVLRYAKGYGLADVENAVPVTPDSVFAVASVSKPLLALAVAQLVEQGRLAWEDPIAKHLPDAPPHWQAVTLAHLANHSAGIVRESPAFDGEKERPDAELVAAAYPLPLLFATGSGLSYCNVCYFALAEVISRSTGKPWPEHLQQALFQPAGLARTRTTSVRDLVPGRVSSYLLEGGQLKNAREYLALRPSGAFLSSVRDLARLEAALQAGTIVSPAMQRRLETPTRLHDGSLGKLDPASIGYGLGWEISDLDGRRRVAHGGSLAGFRTLYARYPDQGWAVILLSNASSTRRGELERAIARRLPMP